MAGTIRRGAAGVALVAVIASLALAPAALAQSSSVNTYGGQGGNVVSKLEGDPSASAKTTGSLPFTGFDIALAAGGGLLLVGAGLALSRIVRPQQTKHQRITVARDVTQGG